jgi:glycine/D-amino acid oxidase-like deaminating enzyme
MFETVDEVGRVTAAEGIDAEYEKGGLLLLARGPHQLPGLQAAHREYLESGLEPHSRWFDPAACAQMVQVAGVQGGIFSPDTATVHPGKLVRGLAQTVERLGAAIHERTAVTGVRTGAHPALLSDRGEVTARTVVLAGEAYLTELPGWHRRLLPLYSLIVLTEPVPEARLREVGWRSRVCLASMRLTVDYLSRTNDGRILFGGRGAPYNFGSRILAQTEHHAATHGMLRQMFREWFPSLSDVRFEYQWGGVLGMPRDWMPTMSLDRSQGLAFAGGYTGHGVATANLAGRVLADLITERSTPLTGLPLINHRSPDWPPEPLRWLGVRYVQSRLRAIDTQAQRSGRAPGGGSLAERLASH